MRDELRARAAARRPGRTIAIAAIVFIGGLGILGGCGGPRGAPPSRDYAAARRRFQTRLVKRGPSPQAAPAVVVPSDARALPYDSDGLQLTAWISAPTADAPRPAVLFVHGGAAFGVEDWEMTRPFRDAGFVVMTPILRGENDQPGAYSFFYDEVDDVLAAADALARQPGVDARRIYLAGHSAGGTIALLAALTSPRFRAAAAFSAAPDFESFAALPGVKESAPFALDDRAELLMRSALVFATSFKCPTRMFWGNVETAVGAANRETARRAREAGLDVAGEEVTGDHHTMLGPAIARAIAFFSQPR